MNLLSRLAAPILAPILAAALLAAVPASADPAPDAGAAWGAAGWRHDPDRTRTGRIYHYLRTNSDGSEPEHVRVYLRTATDLAVNKQVAACTNAAYVTATLDLVAGEARNLTGGRLTREGTQAAFAWLAIDPASPRLSARIELPGQVLEGAGEVSERPRVMYDFDLADLTALTPHLVEPRKGFSFGVALLWPPAMPDFLQDKGRLDAAFVGEETHRGRRALRFTVTGEAFAGKPGTLWLDAAEGHILEAAFPLPNHDNYTDFRLVLERIEDTGEDGWRKILMSHWEGCPPPAG